jgi:hypothetical protein
MVQLQSALGHHFFQVAIAERVAKVPAEAEHNDLVAELPASEQLRSTLTHASPYQTSPRAVATLPEKKPSVYFNAQIDH